MYANLVQQQPIHLYHFLPGKNKNLGAKSNNKNRSLESATKLKKIPI
jgi:DNA polymerase II large subunit